MQTYQIQVKTRRMLSDINTPVSIYLRIRDVYPNSLLLESSDYHATENSYSFICLKPIAFLEAVDGVLTESYPDGTKTSRQITGPTVFHDRFTAFLNAFKLKEDKDKAAVNGLFGYCSYDAVRYFEKIELHAPVSSSYKIPEVHYAFYKYIIAINHFQNNLQLIENQVDGEESELDRIESLLNSRNIAMYSFMPVSEERSNITDGEYMQMVSKGKKALLSG